MAQNNYIFVKSTLKSSQNTLGFFKSSSELFVNQKYPKKLSALEFGRDFNLTTALLHQSFVTNVVRNLWLSPSSGLTNPPRVLSDTEIQSK